MGQTGREEMIMSLLEVPDNFKVVVVIPVGVPDEIPAAKERKSLEDIVSWEKYGLETK
jgi:nitroreductase